MLIKIISMPIFLGLVGCFSMQHNISQFPPPQAQQQNHIFEKHGDKRVDPFFWMRERDAEPVLNYINQENEYAQKVLKTAAPIADQLFLEMKNRISEDESTPPYKVDNFYYYTRYEKGKEYPIYCRKHGSLKNPEQIILDVNTLAKGKKYYSAHVVAPSPDHKMLVFAVDKVGRRFYTLHFKNLETNKILDWHIPNTTGEWVWFNDNQTGYYVKQDKKTLRADRVFRTRLERNQKELVLQEPDELYGLSLEKSLNKKTIFIIAESFDSREYHYIAADNSKSKIKLFKKRQHNHIYELEDGDDVFYIRSNKGRAENFQMWQTKKTASAETSWKKIIAHRKDFLMQGFLVLDNFIVLQGREQGLTQIEVYNRQAWLLQRIPFKESAYVSYLAMNRNPKAKKVRYSYSSLTTPQTFYDYEITSQKTHFIKQTEVPTYNSRLYKTERIWAPARDGQKIPISLVYRKDKFKKGKNPLLQYGYGSYGISMDPHFQSSLVSLLDRGFVYAIAHIRGGQELGRWWYEGGRLKNKMNTFHDFIDVTEYLIQSGYAHPKQVYLRGGSAGGLLVGAVINQRPDLYRGGHAAVPFVDVLSTMLDETLPLTVGEYQQWGNPNVKADYKMIKSYSPYDNITKQDYPHLLITTGYHDSQVQYWEPLKWLAKLRLHNTAPTWLVMRTEMDAGHSGVTGRFARTREVADDYAFFVWLQEQI